MSKISVYLNIGNHPIYFSLISNPPKGILIEKTINLPSKKLSIYSKKKNVLRKITTKISFLLRIPRIFYFKTNADLIHTSRGIIPLNKKPWVMDIEHAKSFFNDHKVLYSERGRRIVKKFLLSKYAKKLMPHCEMAAKSMIYHFGEKLKEKIEVVYPAMEVGKVKARPSKDHITLLFVANKFYEKGGLELIEAFKQLRKKYEEISLLMKTKVPVDLKRKLPENIRLIEKNLSYQNLFKEIYAKSQIFVFPSYIDTFGFALLEAMSVGLPVVATNIFAIPEIIEDEKNGFLINAKKYDWSDENGILKPKWVLKPQERMRMYRKLKEEIVSELKEKLALLIENSSLRKRMGRYGRRLVEKGKFSIRRRNEKLRQIYQEALRR